LVAAILFHDAVYDPQRHDNEIQSAHTAMLHLTHAGCDNLTTIAIGQLILATTHDAHSEQMHKLAVGTIHNVNPIHLIQDIDLSILGSSEEVYRNYTANVRAEYAHVNNADWRNGRSQFLMRMMSKKNIFHAYTQSKINDLHDNALHNMQKECLLLMSDTQ
jgi:predicted metal-dependent HD superfamily phosphohydrolase